MKNSFDEILKKKWENFQFPVDDDHRNEMIRLLDQHNRRRTGLFWWFGGLGGGIIIMAAVILLANRNEAIDPQMPVQPSANVQKEVIAQKSEPDGEKQIYPSGTASEKDVVTEEIVHGSKQDNSGENDSKDNKNSKSVLKQNAITGTTNQKNFQVNSTPLNENTGNTIVAETESSVSPNADHIEVKESNTNNPVATSITLVSPLPSNTTEIKGSAAENEIIDVRRVTEITETIDPLAISDIPYEREKLKKLEPVIVKHHPVYLFAETGLGYIPASQLKYTAGWTMKAGGGISYGLNPKQHISLSMGYLLQKDGFDFEKTSTVNQPTFGARSNFNTLAPEKLHFVYARVGAQQRIRRHILSLFGGVQYLYGAQGSIIIQTQDQLNPVAEESHDNVWLKLDGMTRWLWSGELQYGYQVMSRMSLHAGLKYNFTSIEAIDQVLTDEGYYWDGKISSFSPFFTVNYQLYGKK